MSVAAEAASACGPTLAEQITQFRAMCGRHGVIYAGRQEKLHPRSSYGPMWLFNVPELEMTTRTCAVVKDAAAQEAELARAIEACRAQWGK